jgi:hypothetical protein
MILFLLTVLGTLVCYLLTGLLAAQLSTPRLVREYTYVDGYVDRCDVRRDQVRILWFWPVLLPAAWFASVLDAETDRHDPALHRKQAERIAELEQELGLR